MMSGERGPEGPLEQPRSNAGPGEELAGGGARAGTRSAPGARERDGSSEAETALADETEADPYEVAEQVFRFRAKQLHAAGKLPQRAYEMCEEEFAAYSQQLTELHRIIHEEMGLLWPPPWVVEEGEVSRSEDGG
jgi:hypothetical protein